MSNAFTLSYLVLWIAVLAQSLVLLGLVRVMFRLNEQAAGMAPATAELQGKPVPHFSSTDLSGNLVDSETFIGEQTVLLFTSMNCRSCGESLEDLEVLKEKANGNVIVLCGGGAHDDCVRLAEKHRIDVAVVPDPDHAISKLFRIDAVPTAVLINERGEVQAYGNPMRDGELLEEQIDVEQKEGARV